MRGALSHGRNEAAFLCYREALTRLPPCFRVHPVLLCGSLFQVQDSGTLLFLLICSSGGAQLRSRGWLDSGWKAFVFWESVRSSNLRMQRLTHIDSDLGVRVGAWFWTKVAMFVFSTGVCRYFSLATNSLKIRGHIVMYVYSAPCN